MIHPMQPVFGTLWVLFFFSPFIYPPSPRFHLYHQMGEEEGQIGGGESAQNLISFPLFISLNVTTNKPQPTTTHPASLDPSINIASEKFQMLQKPHLCQGTKQFIDASNSLKQPRIPTPGIQTNHILIIILFQRNHNSKLSLCVIGSLKIRHWSGFGSIKRNQGEEGREREKESCL